MLFFNSLGKGIWHLSSEWGFGCGVGADVEAGEIDSDLIIIPPCFGNGEDDRSKRCRRWGADRDAPPRTSPGDHGEARLGVSLFLGSRLQSSPLLGLSVVLVYLYPRSLR